MAITIEGSTRSSGNCRPKGSEFKTENLGLSSSHSLTLDFLMSNEVTFCRIYEVFVLLPVSRGFSHVLHGL